MYFCGAKLIKRDKGAIGNSKNCFVKEAIVEVILIGLASKHLIHITLVVNFTTNFKHPHILGILQKLSFRDLPELKVPFMLPT